MRYRALGALLLGVLVSGCSGALLGRSYSLDHQHRADLYATLRGMVVHRDGLPVARYPLIDLDTLRLSAAGGHLAFAARAGSGWRVVLDDRALSLRWDAVLPGSLRLGDGGQLCYVARRGTSLFVVHAAAGPGDEVAEGPYDGVADLQVDRAAVHRAYIARRGALAWVVFDGRELGPHEAVAELRLSPQGGRWAAVIRRDQRWWVLHDGVAEPYQSAAGLHFSASGQHLYYVARDDGHERVIHGDLPMSQLGPAFAEVQWRTLQTPLGDDTAGPLYVAAEAGHRFVVHDGKAGPPYDDIRSLHAGGRRFSYIGRRGAKEQAVIDGQPGPWYDEVANPVTADDAVLASFGHAYLARRQGQLLLVLPGRELPLRWALAGSLALCRDGSHVGLLGGVAPQALQVLIDGRPVHTFEAEEPEEVRRVWGALGLPRWVEAELHCAIPGHAVPK